MVERFRLLAQTRRQHQIHASRQGRQGGLCQFLCQRQHRWSHHRLVVHQFLHRARFRHCRMLHLAQYQPLHALPAEGYHHQMARPNLTFQFGGQVVVEDPHHIGYVDGNFLVSGHLGDAISALWVSNCTHGRCYLRHFGWA